MANLFNYGDTEDNAEYYPSPITRKLPDWAWKLRWFGARDDTHLGELFYEIYEAVQGKQYRLAAMGIRAFLEQMMISKVGDSGSFEANLNAFEKKGYISQVQKNAMASILDSGHAVIHRMHKPEEADLKTALDIAESITAAIYFHEEAAKAVAAKAPPRRTR